MNAAKLRVANDGEARYREKRALLVVSQFVPEQIRQGNWKTKLVTNPGGTAEEPFVPDVDEGIFVFIGPWTISYGRSSMVNGQI